MDSREEDAEGRRARGGGRVRREEAEARLRREALHGQAAGDQDLV